MTEVCFIFSEVFIIIRFQKMFIVNHVVQIPNPKYPTAEELNILKNFMEMTRSSKQFLRFRGNQ
jgi:hypothetical protein